MSNRCRRALRHRAAGHAEVSHPRRRSEPGLHRIARVETIAEALNDAERKALREQRPRLNALVATALRGAAPPPTLSDEELVNGLAQPYSAKRASGTARTEGRGGARRSAHQPAGAQESRPPGPRSWEAPGRRSGAPILNSSRDGSSRPGSLQIQGTPGA